MERSAAKELARKHLLEHPTHAALSPYPSTGGLLDEALLARQALSSLPLPRRRPPPSSNQ